MPNVIEHAAIYLKPGEGAYLVLEALECSRGSRKLP